MTVTSKNEKHHNVTAIDETIIKSNYRNIEIGSLLNLERCLKVGARLDGHMVQGHVDETAECIDVVEDNGSWRYFFKGMGNQNGPPSLFFFVVVVRFPVFQFSRFSYLYFLNFCRLYLNQVQLCGAGGRAGVSGIPGFPENRETTADEYFIASWGI